jgi:DNA anti-recombination protein RmuC
MRILAIVRDIALIVCAITLTLTTVYFANEYRGLRADLAALRALPAELSERIRDRIEASGEQLRDRTQDAADRLRERTRESADKLRERAKERFGRDKQD